MKEHNKLKMNDHVLIWYKSYLEQIGCKNVVILNQLRSETYIVKGINTENKEFETIYNSDKEMIAETERAINSHWELKEKERLKKDNVRRIAFELKDALIIKATDSEKYFVRISEDPLLIVGEFNIYKETKKGKDKYSLFSPKYGNELFQINIGLHCVSNEDLFSGVELAFEFQKSLLKEKQKNEFEKFENKLKENKLYIY